MARPATTIRPSAIRHYLLWERGRTDGIPAGQGGHGPPWRMKSVLPVAGVSCSGCQAIQGQPEHTVVEQALLALGGLGTRGPVRQCLA